MTAKKKTILADKKEGKKTPLASLHIGASSVSLFVAEQDEDGHISTIDFLEQPVSLAHDIFGLGMITPSTTSHVVDIIRHFQKSLIELGRNPNELTRAVASNIVPEAINVDVFLNRIRIACGIEVTPVDDGEMTRLIYLKTRRRLKDTPAMKSGTTLVVHVGPGNTRALLFKKGAIARYTSYRLGAHRTREAIDQSNLEGTALLHLIRQHISGNLEQIGVDYAAEKIEALVIIGYELQHIAPMLGKAGVACSVKKLKLIANDASSLTDYDLVKKYKLDYHTAEAFLPALQTTICIADIFKLTDIHIPHSDYERGLLHDLLISKTLIGTFESEVLAATKILAKRYHSDARHGEHVAMISAHIFEKTYELHQLGAHEALLLQVAALLHEAGSYISPRSHHKHSQYIILNSEIFGLDRLDITIVSLIARYHRHSVPLPEHPIYCDLSIENRIRVCKLASILRVADALERTHHQRVHDIIISTDADKLTLRLPGIHDVTVEKLAMLSKADLFTQTFGLEVIVEPN